MARILIKNGRVWDGERFFPADVLTEGRYITKIEPHISEQADFVYDASGKTVSAGLVDIHVHMRGISIEAFGVQAEMSCFPFGVTAAADAGGSLGDQTLLDSYMPKSAVFVGVSIRNNRADPEQTQAALSLYGDKAVGLKVYFDTTVSEVTDTAPLQQICDFAHQRGLRVMVHCSNSPVTMSEIVRTLQAGDILTHAFHGGNNTCADNEFEAFQIAKEKGIVIDTGFAGHVHTDFAIFRQAIHAGFLPHTISTDITCNSAFKRGGRYGMTMCMNMAETVGMCEGDIFKAVTSSPAKVLGKENEWGYLKVGRTADMAVFDYTDEAFDLTDHAGNRIMNHKGYKCVLTVSDGQVVYGD